MKKEIRYQCPHSKPFPRFRACLAHKFCFMCAQGTDFKIKFRFYSKNINAVFSTQIHSDSVQITVFFKGMFYKIICFGLVRRGGDADNSTQAFGKSHPGLGVHPGFWKIPPRVLEKCSDTTRI